MSAAALSERLRALRGEERDCAPSMVVSWVEALRGAAADGTLTAKDLRDAGMRLPDNVPNDATYRDGTVEIGEPIVDGAGVASVPVRLEGGFWLPRVSMAFVVQVGE